MLSAPKSPAAALRRLFLVLAVLSAALTLFDLASFTLQSPDEGRYAEAAREMVESGNWLVPQFAYQERLNKPPLIYWTTAAAVRVFGPQEWAVRLVPALAAALGVLVIHLLGTAMAGRKAGTAAAVVLLTSLWYAALARIIVTDMLLCLGFSLTLAGFWWAHRSRSWEHYGLMTLGAVIGSLTKGPVSVALPALIIAVYLTVTRQWRTVSWPKLLACIPLYLLLVVPWFAAVQHRYPGFLQYTFLSENLGRFAGKYHSEEPVYFYVPVLLVGLGVWVLPLLRTALADWKLFRSEGLRHEAAHSQLFLWLWFLGIFGFFSISKAKLPTYILPCFPAAALLLGLSWARAFEEEVPADLQRGCRRMLGLLTAIAALAGVGVIAYGALGKSPGPEERLPAAGWAAAGMLASLPLLVRALRKPTAHGTFTALALSGFLICTGMLQATKVVLSANAIAPLADAAARQSKPGDDLILFRADKATAAFFYVGRSLGSARAVRSVPPLPRQNVYGSPADEDDTRQGFGAALQELVATASEHHRTFCILRRRDYQKARSRMAEAGLRHVVKENLEYVLVSSDGRG